MSVRMNSSAGISRTFTPCSFRYSSIIRVESSSPWARIIRSWMEPKSSRMAEEIPSKQEWMNSRAIARDSSVAYSSRMVFRYFSSSLPMISRAPSELRLYRYPHISTRELVVPDMADNTTKG